MRLSVIIVNYNVRAFLEQALLSVRPAMQGIEGDVWVVDNNSTDDSVRMVRERFPEVRLLANTDNPGFAVANNQAIRQSTGAYVLLLNPDTVVEADTFRKCLDFMDAHPDAGALGVKMLDGSGRFLPESKRGFPSPWVAFCKTAGLAAFFPKSRLFNGYYLGHLGENDTSQVDVLAGCFMFIRRAVLDKAGLLDEAFFMYGEDIDLSYRIQQAGYKNYYFPETRILHYKGESTKKGSLNYVRTFYQAMIIFTRKHFRGRRAGLFIGMLQVAIWLRASLALLSSAAHRIWLPVVDTVLLYGGLFFLQDFWANYYYKDPHYFKAAVLWFNFPLYTLVWLVSVWLSGGYDRRYDLLRLLRGVGLGTLLLAAIYGFLDLEYRPSRALLLLGGVWAAMALAGLRVLLHFVEFRNFRIGRERVKNLLLVGSPAESERVRQLLSQAGVAAHFIGAVAPDACEQLPAQVRIFQVDEIIFCSRDLPVQDILAWMTRLGPKISYKIVPAGSQSIIGSSSKDEPGELYTVDTRYNIAQPGQRRNKRVFDLGVCLLLLLALPLWVFFSKSKKAVFQNWWSVLTGRKHWVGYAPTPGNDSLPRLHAGVFGPASGWGDLSISGEMTERLNFLYAKDWNVWKDAGTVFRALSK
ncbi:MAG: glycosyltransferase [Lewinellaceae bacterium]|nr:glycosyltransferase [Lewinellaceae bacterium]